MTLAFDPYQQWLGITREEQPANYYRMLGVRLFESDPQVIHAAAERKMAYVRARAAGPQAVQGRQVLAELAAARQCLSDPQQKAVYDRGLTAASAPPAMVRPAPSTGMPAVAMPAAKPAVRAPRPIAIAVQPTPAPVWQCEPEAPAFGIQTGPSSYRPRPRSGSGVGIFAGLALAAAAGVGGYFYAQHQKPPIAKVIPEVTTATPVVESKAKVPVVEPVKEPTKTITKTPVKTAPVVTTKTPVKTTPVEVVAPVTPPPVVVNNPPSRDPGEFDDPAIIRRPRSFGGRFDLSSLVAAAGASDPEAAAKIVDPEMFPLLKQKLPVPGASEQSKALNAIRATFRKDYQSAVQPAAKVTLARTLLSEAARSIDDATSRFVYLAEARDLAIDGSSPALSMQMVDTLSRMYAIDPVGMKYSTLSRGAGSAKTNVAQRSISTNALAMIETAIVANDFDSANRLLELGLSSARTAKDGKLVKLASELRGELKSVTEQFQQAETARATLAKTPEDAEANLTLGRYLSRAGDWTEALPYLAKGTDVKLAGLAARDLAKPTVAVEQRGIGDAWWDLGEGADEGTRGQYRQRACHWYEQAVGKLDSLAKFQVEFRLKQVADAAGEGVATVVEPASPDSLPPLARKLLGRYDLVAIEKKTQQRKTAQWELLATKQATEEGRVVATWDLEDTTRLKVTFLDTDRGVVYLRFNTAKTQLTGGMTMSTGEMWKWELNRSSERNLGGMDDESLPIPIPSPLPIR